MKTPKHIETNTLYQNNNPLDDFLGLSATEIHQLLYDTYDDKSIIQFRKDIEDEILDLIPLFRIAEDYLMIIQRDKQIKLTPLGALPKKVIVELYEKRYLLDENIENGITKLWREEDLISIKSARLAVELAGLVKKVSGKLTLTKTANKLLENNNRIQLFHKFFQAFTDKFLWSFNDAYPEQHTAQFGWAFSIYILHKFGDQARAVDFYADKYRKAFPQLITYFQPDYTTPERQFNNCYGLRTFERFFLWFGFATVEKQKKFLDLDHDTFKKTDLVNSIFKFARQ